MTTQSTKFAISKSDVNVLLQSIQFINCWDVNHKGGVNMNYSLLKGDKDGSWECIVLRDLTQPRLESTPFKFYSTSDALVYLKQKEEDIIVAHEKFRNIVVKRIKN